MLLEHLKQSLPMVMATILAGFKGDLDRIQTRLDAIEQHKSSTTRAMLTGAVIAVVSVALAVIARRWL